MLQLLMKPSPLVGSQHLMGRCGEVVGGSCSYLATYSALIGAALPHGGVGEVAPAPPPAPQPGLGVLTKVWTVLLLMLPPTLYMKEPSP